MFKTASFLRCCCTAWPSCSRRYSTPGLTLIAELFPAVGRGRVMGYSDGRIARLCLVAVAVQCPDRHRRLAHCGAVCPRARPGRASLLAARRLRSTRNVVHPAGYANPLRALAEANATNPRCSPSGPTYSIHGNCSAFGPGRRRISAWCFSPTGARAAPGGRPRHRVCGAYLSSQHGGQHVGGGVLSGPLGRTAVILLMSLLASLICSFTFRLADCRTGLIVGGRDRLQP